MVALAGAGPWPQITSVRPRLVSWTMIGTSPPGPFRCGSTTCSVKAVATPASNALPPFSKMLMPTAVAIQWVEVTTPKVPSISGRVVNGSGLMLLMGVQCGAGILMLKHLTTGEAGCQPLACHAWLSSPWSYRGGGLNRMVDGMAGDAVDQGGRFLPAEIERQRAARVEGTSRRRV